MAITLTTTNSFLLILLASLLSATVPGQQLTLNKINQYSFLTHNNNIASVLTDTKALFVNSKDKFYFNLSPVRPGLSSGIVIGKVENEVVSILDTIDIVGVPDFLVDFYFDENEDIYTAADRSYGGNVKKISSDGQELWVKEYFSDTLNTPWHFYQSNDGNPLVLIRRMYPDTTFSTVAQKLDKSTGELIWENEFAPPPSGYFIPAKVREIEGNYQVFSSHYFSILITQIDQQGNLVHQIEKPNPLNEDIFDNIHIDSLGYSYPGLNAWGYRLPKIDVNGDSVWYYERSSPIGDDLGNRTKNILTDSAKNVYISGPFRLEVDGLISLIVTKLNSIGELQWEQISHDVDASKKFFTENSYLYKNRIWISGSAIYAGNQIGSLYCLDLQGNILIYQEFEELSPKGISASLDFFDDEILITGSSKASPRFHFPTHPPLPH